MKRYILLAGIAAITLVISGCTNNKNSIETVKNNSTVSTEIASTQEKSDLKKPNEDEIKALEASFKEIKDLKKPDIEVARDFKGSLGNGSVIMLSRDNSSPQEVYNISMLDKFLDSFNSGKEGYVRVVKGTLKSDGKLLVNKLTEYETDGKVIKETVYDTYADKNKFIPGKPTYSPKMAKTYPGNGIRYAILESKDTPDNMGATVISFDKSSIKN
ncbi:DUF4362 domain-containing protein [Clostridium omnivorum]|uniref:Lipoprotein n=1 Tax=Clostridium omnivorum TaxID=1604902 RepID=A0ABQ5N4U8_9CLOT|nr:DUF4362 domain-containing protein [Clostridium sp. E14]GLC30236.1 hypothetical protein bsdE14_16460 [Clostridium sp. E14]